MSLEAGGMERTQKLTVAVGKLSSVGPNPVGLTFLTCGLVMIPALPGIWED